MDITAIYFDLGNVVFNYDPAIRLDRLVAASGMDAETLQRILFDSGFSEQCDEGLYTAEAMYEEACGRLGWHPSFAEFQALWISVFTPNTEVIALARALSRTHKVGLLTNNPPILRRGLSSIHAGMEDIFDPMLFSGELKAKKPAEAIYRKAIDAMACAPGEILFIDDSSTYLRAARAFGIHTILYTTTPQLVEDLQQRTLVA